MPTAQPIELVVSRELSNTLGIPRNLHARLGLAAAESVVLRVGSRRAHVPIRLLPDATESRVHIGAALSRSLALPNQPNVHLRRNPDGSLEVGPFLGILARPIPAGPPYGEQNRDFRVHMAMGKRRSVVVYTFGPNDIDWRNKAVRARLYDETRQRWVRRIMPIPHVVWNRSYWPGSRNRALLRRTITGLQRFGASPFNPGVGTKWQVGQLLSSEPTIRPHVPVTEQYRGIQTVLNLLRRFPGVYMKPLWGGWGIGIMRIRSLGGGRYRASRTIGRAGRNWTRVVDQAGLRSVVRRLVDGPYLVQQEILLAQLDGRVCDVRVLAQRRADGEWGVTGSVIRVGKPRSVISNLHGGGQAMEIHSALTRIFPGRPEFVVQTVAKVHELALAVVRKVESRFGRFGEIGLDFGIDQAGHVWFIEVNSRPGRHSFRITSPDDVWLASSANPVEYAKHLATFE